MPVVKPPPGSRRRRPSCPRRSMSAKSGGPPLPPPGDAGPRPQGPLGPPVPLPPDELVQGMGPLCSLVSQGSAVYVHRRRGANALDRYGRAAEGFKDIDRTMAHATRDEVLRALDQVIDPVSGRSVVQEDIVQGLRGRGRSGARRRRRTAAPGLRGRGRAASRRSLGDRGAHRAPGRAGAAGAAAPRAAAQPSRRAAAGAGRHSRRRRHHRGGERQGRRRQIDRRGQSRHRARPAGPESRADGRRYLRPLGAAPVRHPREAAHGRQEDRPDREIRHQDHVARLSPEGGRSGGVARPDGAERADPDAERHAVGAARHPGARHAAGHRRCAAHHLPARAPCAAR